MTPSSLMATDPAVAPRELETPRESEKRDRATPLDQGAASGGLGPNESEGVGLGEDVWVAGRVGAARITKVGLWIALLTLVLSVAAANTGNNSLYLLISLAAAMLVAAWWIARGNVKGIELLVRLPDELYAGVPALAKYRVRRRGRGQATDILLLMEGSRSGALLREVQGPGMTRAQRRPTHVGGTGARATILRSEGSTSSGRARNPVSTSQEVQGEQQVLFLRRGLHRVGQARVLSLFPMGIFRRYVTFSASREVIVLPEIFSGVRVHRSTSPRGWREAGTRVGRSEGLHSLRSFRSGDDPRSIHWKQSARNSQLIFQERSEDEARRVSVLVDSLVPAAVATDESRFERLVSEAATACVEYLDRGYEVELVLHEGTVEFGVGRWHRSRLLEALALLQFRVVGADDVHQAGSAPSLAASDGQSHELGFSLKNRRQSRRDPSTWSQPLENRSIKNQTSEKAEYDASEVEIDAQSGRKRL